jgi:hypothetical protein
LLKNVEKRIWDVERFAVAIRYPAGRDIRGDKGGIPMYPFEYGAKNSLTVAAWKEQRFRPHYVNFEVDVLDANGIIAEGHTHLATVRDSYLED